MKPLLVGESNYQLEAEAHFDDRSDAQRVFIGRLVMLGSGYFTREMRSEFRAWSLCIRVRSLPWEAGMRSEG